VGEWRSRGAEEQGTRGPLWGLGAMGSGKREKGRLVILLGSAFFPPLPLCPSAPLPLL